MFAKRMDRLGTETAFEVLARAKALEAQGRDIVHLEIGEPDFDTPDNIRKAAEKAIWAGYTHYGPSAGLMEVRECICEYFAKDRGVQYTPDQIIVTPGGKPIIFLPILALVDHGDEVIYPNPGYPIYESAINFAGGKPVPLVYSEERDFRFDMAELEAKISPKTKMLIINSPGEPDGRHPRGERPQADRGALRQERRGRALGRGLLQDHLRRKAPLHRDVPGHEGAHDPHGRALEDVRDDGVAPRVRGDAEADRREDDEAEHERLLARDDVRPDRGHRGPQGAAGQGDGDGRHVRQEAQGDRRRE